MSKKGDKYLDLDKRLDELMRKFFEDYPNETDVSYTGSVFFGEWKVHRRGFDGFKFLLNDVQQAELITKNQTIVREDDLIHQHPYE